jgi:hypothetical protein
MQATEIMLSKAEWTTVAVAMKDATGFGCSLPAEPGSLRHRLQKIGQALFGWEPRLGLADPRLETLRRFVCSSRAQRHADEAMVPALLAQGFNRAQVEALALLSR